MAMSQNEMLAKGYFERGEFQKALVSYQKLYESQKGNANYLLKIIQIHQQLEQFDISEKLLIQQVAASKNPQYLVELGYNFQLKGDQEKADLYYNQAMQKIEENPIYAYYVARRFEEHVLIDRAAIVYERAMELRPESNYNIQLARIYGEQGKVEKMFGSYVDFIEKNKNYLNQAKRAFSQYISENSADENNVLLRKVILRKIQSKPDILWNQLLSWLFVQQKEYNKAFAQEKAIYKRLPENLGGVKDLARISIESDEVAIANKILLYLIDNGLAIETVIDAHRNLLELEIKHAQKSEYNNIDQKFKNILNKFGKTPQTIDLQISYGHFLAFNLNNTKGATAFLKETLKIRLPRVQMAKIKLKLGDILVYQEKFNEALIYYSQIQTSLKNSTISQEARLRVAKTSYYKGDFNWAESQLKILKASSSQLIANDALDLKLLISDNKFEDSTQTALKLYAKADLLAFQNKTDDAIETLGNILENHKTESIIDQALFQQAILFKKKKEYSKAAANYIAIIENYKEDILADDAYFYLAELYVNYLHQPEKAKELYEQIIFNHADSIYFVEARKKYRTLRGDAIN